MQTAINALKLSLLISLGLVFLFGQGWFLIGQIIHGISIKQKSEIPFIEKIPLALLGGLIINYGITLVFQSLLVSLIIGLILSLIGLLYFSMNYIRFYSRRVPSLTFINKSVGAAFVCLLFLIPILADPLSDWDARSIWFFHAKMIYEAGSIGQLAGWEHLSVAFSHPDYPKLVPALAAQVTYVVGFWNEYIPKLSLFFLLIPGVTWLFSFARRSFSFLILLLLIPFSFYPWMWNGYMDGFLALYFSIALLLLGRYARTSQSIDLVSSLCCLVILLYIKNEGMFAALTGLSAIIFVFLFKKKFQVKSDICLNSKYFLVGIILLLPLITWEFYKNRWNLSNDLQIGTNQSMIRIISRLTDGSYKFIIHEIYKQIEYSSILLGLLYFGSYIWKKPFANEAFPALVAAAIYCLGITLIYLLTPHDLEWHLNFSVGRTMLPINGSMFIASYYILNKIENSQNTP